MQYVTQKGDNIMGLDQYAFSVKNKAIINRFEYNQDYKHDEIFYCRKNRFLHNWMEELYQSLGGKEEFNMKNLQLLPEDIDRLEEDTKSGKIKEYDADGFFFGKQTFGNLEYESIMDFCERAREEFKYGNAVFYDSWY